MRRGLTRRRLGALSAGLLGGLALPRGLSAASGGDRRFLFVFVQGGWDPVWAIAPMFDASGVDNNPDGEPAEEGGIPFVDSPDMPSVRAFFEDYADVSALVHGFEVRSITHERCRRLLLTASSQAEADDWPSRIAGAGEGYLLPHVVVSGPAYTSTYTTSVIRLGETGQLAGLLDGTALSANEPAVTPLEAEAEAAIEAYLTRRREGWMAEAGRGRASVVAADLARAAEQVALVGAADDLDLSIALDDITPVPTLVEPALTCLERGYARTAIVAHKGLYNRGWDTHSETDQQVNSYELLFDDLRTILADLAARPGPAGGSLAEQTTVVVFSEMGRAPRINALGGKDHWTFTSMMFIGAGVRGGRVIGGYDQDLLGQPVDLASGEASASGTLLGAEHIGATLLAMAGIEPEDEPIRAVFE